MLVQILRPISGLDARVNDVVDASDWPENRVRQFIKQRRVAMVASPATTQKGRRHEAADAR